MSQKLVYEHPLNERIRTFLRLEHLFAKAEHFLGGEDPWETRAAIEALLEIVTVTARADVKNELLRELDRHSAALNRIRRQAGVHVDTLDQILAELGEAVAALHALDGQVGQRARDDGLLKAVAQRTAIPGGTCSFDLPLYHSWLAQPGAVRGEWLAAWMEDMRPASEAIGLILTLTRTSASPRPETAPLGFFQESLDSQLPAQMIRVGLEAQEGLFPEISGHKNRYSIRFMEVVDGAKPVQSRDDVAFSLTCCLF
ncbi:cell division protein ZapD [Thioflavicoccus mobilis]|uniref:cell division protein ZapD n=1 Tax=Thioflavicoccus mobilis TaxID=80679 RepID=UPI0002E234A5|nr:cell division protein ZapD [Thioflavicoccus mobilis]